MNDGTHSTMVMAAQSALICRLRPKTVIGREGPIPNMGEIELENRSTIPVEIEYTMTPLQFLEMEVMGPGHEIVSDRHFSDCFSPTRDPSVLRLMPGEKFTSNVPLLSTVPREKRVPGTYTVQASYCFRGILAVAEPLQVQFTPREKGEKKT